MKTKITTLIIICTLGLVGVLNANAALSYKTSCIAGTMEEAKNAKSENLNSLEFSFNEDAEFDYQKEAQMVTKCIADNEEAKTIQMLIDKGMFAANDENASFTDEAKSENLNSAEFSFSEDAVAEIDFQKEAQLLTKWIADNEEAKTIQMLIDKGMFASNEETASFTDEATSENLNSAEFVFNEDAKIDFQKEAQLITKWNADNEEARAVQKLIDEAKLAENK